jgi:hypothetical protein
MNVIDHPKKFAARSTSRLFLMHVSLCVLLLSGCVNLSEVQKFSSISVQSADFTTLTNDYVATYRRTLAYDPRGESPDAPLKIKKRQQQVEELLKIQKVLSSYMQALGDLSANKTVDFSTQTKDLINSINKVGLVSSNDIKATQSLAQTLAQAVADAYRRVELARIIRASNADVQTLIGTLKTFIGRAYSGDLAIELIATQDTYDAILHNTNTSGPNSADLLLKEQLAQQLDSINAKQQAAKTYSTLLDKIAKAHQTLYDDSSSGINAHALQDLATYTEQLEPLLTQVLTLRKNI